MRTPVFGYFPRFNLITASFILALLIASSVTAQSQITTGTIQGNVVDANGAAVPGANVEIKNLDTNFTRSLTTDEEGRFVALQLQPGNYSVTVTKQGFKSNVLERAELTVGGNLTPSFSLGPADVAGTVDVTTNPTIDPIKTQSSTTI